MANNDSDKNEPKKPNTSEVPPTHQLKSVMDSASILKLEKKDVNNKNER